jgi:hypothetical protein
MTSKSVMRRLEAQVPELKALKEQRDQLAACLRECMQYLDWYLDDFQHDIDNGEFEGGDLNDAHDAYDLATRKIGNARTLAALEKER